MQYGYMVIHLEQITCYKIGYSLHHLHTFTSKQRQEWGVLINTNYTTEAIWIKRELYSAIIHFCEG